jgi:hypothetical protein
MKEHRKEWCAFGMPELYPTLRFEEMLDAVTKSPLKVTHANG